MTSSPWDRLSSDLTELILSSLPLRSILVAGAVCKQWRAVVTHPFFSRAAGGVVRQGRRRPPWFFLFGHNNLVPLLSNAAFGFDSDVGEWVSLPPSPVEFFAAASGFSFAAAAGGSRLTFAPLLVSGKCCEMKPLRFSRCNPLVAVAGNYARPIVLVVGGSRFVGGLVDVEDSLAVEIYDAAAEEWTLGPPLPPEFPPGISSQGLSSALLQNKKGSSFFVFCNYSCSVATFDIARRTWSGGVRTLRPPGVNFAFLVSGSADHLILAGLRNAHEGNGTPELALWVVDGSTLAYQEIGTIPTELLAGMFDIATGDDYDNKFASLKCVGCDGIVYVFNEDHHKAYPACVCEIVEEEGNGVIRCFWKKVPPLPAPVYRFHKMVAFCSPILVEHVLAAGPGQH